MDRLTLTIFCLLTTLISTLSVYSLVSHNPWSTAVLVWFVIHAIVLWQLNSRASSSSEPRRYKLIKIAWFGLSTLAALAFVATLRPPITSVVVTVRDIPATSQFSIKTVDLSPENKEIIREASRVHDTVSAGRVRDQARFMLLYPIKEDIRRFEIRFGNHAYPWTLESIEIGTDFARIPIPVAKWTGAEIADNRFLKPLMTVVEPQTSTGYSKLTTDRTETKHATRPAVRLNLSRAIVVKQADNSIYETIRAGWFLLFMASLFLASWTPAILGLVKRIASKTPTDLLLRYLTSTTRPTVE